ncbi:hypothetical protein SteCoe_30196 [Stentor coeruleus]|uniref:Major facilitator superfamily (MFS) profile domain-containing protein n=1 Tax=Stentor coeruleus TaxID=5963 RepID=A0A1R2B482_9CILI|nr:hypothetical protein SteCoe_30196 [Stentor coeruleus]
MHEVPISEAIEMTSGNLKYQYFIAIILGLCNFVYSSYVLGFPFMLSQDKNGPNATNSLELFDDRENIKHLITKAFFLGIPFGALVLSLLSDKYGRKKVFEITIRCYCLFTFMICITLTHRMLIVFSFLLGFLFQNGICSVFIMMIEILPIDSRVKMTCFVVGCWGLGLIYNSLLYFFGISWRVNLLFITVLLVVIIKMLEYAYESPRILFINSGNKQAHNVLNEICIYNEQGEFTNQIFKSSAFVEGYCYYGLFKRNLIKTTFLCVLFWLSTILLYSELAFINVTIFSDIHYNGITIGIIEIGSMALLSIFGNKIQRKQLFFYSLITTRIGIILTAQFSYFTPESLGIVLPFLVTKLGLWSELYLMLLVTGELFPTYYRSTGYGFCTIIGSIGFLAHNWLVDYTKIFNISSTIITVILSCLSFVSVYFIHETGKSKLKDFTESENYSIKESIPFNLI